jgi:hypothetical protein
MQMAEPRFRDPAVKAVYMAMPALQRQLALRLRRMVFETAACTEGVGELDEELRWRQPSYLTRQTGSGSTIRIDTAKGSQTEIALYFHCQTSLAEEFRQHYGNQLRVQGERAIVFDINETLTEKSISHCIALALTYHYRKKKRD